MSWSLQYSIKVLHNHIRYINYICSIKSIIFVYISDLNHKYRQNMKDLTLGSLGGVDSDPAVCIWGLFWLVSFRSGGREDDLVKWFCPTWRLQTEFIVHLNYSSLVDVAGWMLIQYLQSVSAQAPGPACPQIMLTWLLLKKVNKIKRKSQHFLFLK